MVINTCEIVEKCMAPGGYIHLCFRVIIMCEKVENGWYQLVIYCPCVQVESKLYQVVIIMGLYVENRW